MLQSYLESTITVIQKIYLFLICLTRKNNYERMRFEDLVKKSVYLVISHVWRISIIT